MITSAQVREIYLAALNKAAAAIEQMEAEYSAPDQLLKLGLMAGTMGPQEQAYITPEMLAQLQEVFNAAK